MAAKRKETEEQKKERRARLKKAQGEIETDEKIKQFTQMFFNMLANKAIKPAGKDWVPYWESIIDEGEVGADLAEVRGYRCFEMTHTIQGGTGKSGSMSAHVEIRVYPEKNEA